MINYARGYRNLWRRLVQCRGSVFPFAFCVALPSAAATASLKWFIVNGYLPALDEEGFRSILRDNSCWSGFVFLVGFLTVFRTSQAYARFCEGCNAVHVMRAEWCDACAVLMSFTRCSRISDAEALQTFEGILVRLFSMLHAVALAEIEDNNSDEVLEEAEAFKYDLVDPSGLDPESLAVVRACECKVELVFQWIQQLIVENIDTGVMRVPPPILSNAFRELANGMIAFRGALRLSSIPFPFPYAQVCEWLLIMHWLATPLVVSQYVSTPFWGAVFSFLQVFVYWCMNAIAGEIENPFGHDANDLNARLMQEEVNRHLLLLTQSSTKRTPTMVKERPAQNLHFNGGWGSGGTSRKGSRSSLAEVWHNMDECQLMQLPARGASNSLSSWSLDANGASGTSLGMVEPLTAPSTALTRATPQSSWSSKDSRVQSPLKLGQRVGPPVHQRTAPALLDGGGGAALPAIPASPSGGGISASPISSLGDSSPAEFGHVATGNSVPTVFSNSWKEETKMKLATIQSVPDLTAIGLDDELDIHSASSSTPRAGSREPADEDRETRLRVSTL